MKTVIDQRTKTLVVMILLAGLWRLSIAGQYSPLNNFTPIGAMAIFGGSYFSNKTKAYLLPLLSLWISDLALNYFVYYHKFVWFYEGFLWTYLSFALMVAIGTLMKKVTVRTFVLSAASSAIIHFLISNFGVWLQRTCVLTGKPFDRDFNGLMLSYELGLPYLYYMLVGNIVFGTILFGSFELAQKKFPQLAVK